MCYLGIDGGGTRSRLVVTDEDNNILGLYEGLSTNLASNTEEVVSENLKNLVSEFFKESGKSFDNCKSLCIGSAGIDVPENALCMEAILKRIGFKCPIIVLNDAEIILWAEMKSDPGIVIISGTGSVSYGKDQEGKTARCGGWGHLLDDAGSAYWIGKEILRRVFMAFDGRGKDTILIELTKKHFNINQLEDAIPIIYDNEFNKQKIASLAVLSEKAMENNDEVCGEILNEAVDGLLEIVHALTKELHLKEIPSKIILSGGMIGNNKYMRDLLSEKIINNYKNVSVTMPSQEPVMGAVYLAKKMIS